MAVYVERLDSCTSIVHTRKMLTVIYEVIISISVTDPTVVIGSFKMKSLML